MILYVGMIFALLLAGGRPRIRGLHEGYLSKESTDAVRGVFILLIFASHFAQHVDRYTLPMDLAYWRLRIALGQAVVTCFFLYSGYGVALSADKKGQDYVRTMPARRILPTLLVYDCSMLLCAITLLGEGERFTLGYFVRSLIAWERIGNDNWYIFVITALYTITWLVLRKRPVRREAVMAITTCCVGLMLALICAGRSWYNTLLCYPLGMWYYLYKEKIDVFLGRRSLNYFAAAACAAALYIGFHKLWEVNLLCYVITMMLFALCVVLFTMKFEIKNPVLIYCGQHLQGLFLLHRIPMIVLQKYFDTGSESPARYLYFALCVALTFLLEAVFSRWVRAMGIGKKPV